MVTQPYPLLLGSNTAHDACADFFENLSWLVVEVSHGTSQVFNLHLYFKLVRFLSYRQERSLHGTFKRVFGVYHFLKTFFFSSFFLIYLSNT